MFKTLTPLLGAALLAATTSLYAQSTPSTPAPAPKAPHARHHFDCSKAKDPKACQERIEKLRAARAEALKACEGKQGAEHRDCMVKQGCAKSKDAAKCEARVKQRMEKRAQRRAQRQQQGEKK